MSKALDLLLRHLTHEGLKAIGARPQLESNLRYQCEVQTLFDRPVGGSVDTQRSVFSDPALQESNTSDGNADNCEPTTQTYKQSGRPILYTSQLCIFIRPYMRDEDRTCGEVC